jgi:DNA-binding MarR family transcriptional regulator
MNLVRYAGLLHPDQSPPAQAIPLSQAFALHELDTDTPLTQRELAQRLGLEKSTVSRLVADMESQGLLTRERDPGNRRFYRLQLTDRGHAAHIQMASGFHRRYARLVSGITAAERDALVSGLPALVRVLRQELDPLPDSRP